MGDERASAVETLIKELEEDIDKINRSWQEIVEKLSNAEQQKQITDRFEAAKEEIRVQIRNLRQVQSGKRQRTGDAPPEEMDVEQIKEDARNAKRKVEAEIQEIIQANKKPAVVQQPPTPEPVPMPIVSFTHLQDKRVGGNWNRSFLLRSKVDEHYSALRLETVGDSIFVSSVAPEIWKNAIKIALGKNPIFIFLTEESILYVGSWETDSLLRYNGTRSDSPVRRIIHPNSFSLHEQYATASIETEKNIVATLLWFGEVHKGRAVMYYNTEKRVDERIVNKLYEHDYLGHAYAHNPALIYEAAFKLPVFLNWEDVQFSTKGKQRVPLTSEHSDLYVADTEIYEESTASLLLKNNNYEVDSIDWDSTSIKNKLPLTLKPTQEDSPIKRKWLAANIITDVDENFPRSLQITYFYVAKQARTLALPFLSEFVRQNIASAQEFDSLKTFSTAENLHRWMALGFTTIFTHNVKSDVFTLENSDIIQTIRNGKEYTPLLKSKDEIDQIVGDFLFLKSK